MDSKSLQALKEKRAKIDAQIASLKSREKLKQRKDDTRRKVLIGASIMKEIEEGRFSEHQLDEIIERNLIRPNDRKLFNLDPKTKKTEIMA